MKNPSKGKLVADSSLIRELPSERHSFRPSFHEDWLIYWLVDLFIYLFTGSRNVRV